MTGGFVSRHTSLKVAFPVKTIKLLKKWNKQSRKTLEAASTAHLSSVIFRAPDYFQYTESVQFETILEEGDAAVDAPLVQRTLCYRERGKVSL